MRLQGKVALISGAASGMGAATARLFAREGAKVLCVDHNLASAQETVDMIAAKGGTATAFKADATKVSDLKAMAEDAVKRWGRIDILHNNVGVSLSGGDAELPDAPETVNAMPEKDGWFSKVKLSNPAELDALMDRAAYEQFLSTL